MTSLKTEKQNNNMLFVKEHENSEMMKVIQQEAIKMETINKEFLEEMFDKCLENNRQQDEMTVVEKKNDEHLNTIQTQKQECIDLSVKECESCEKIIEL